VLARVVVLFSAFSPSIIAGQSALGETNDVILPSAIKFAAEAHSLVEVSLFYYKCSASAHLMPDRAPSQAMALILTTAEERDVWMRAVG
jgi:hypothetical protein